MRRVSWKVAGSNSKTERLANSLRSRIEELVVEDAARLARLRLLADDPRLLGVQVGLRRAALDHVAQRLLPAVGLGQVVLVEEEQADGQAAAMATMGITSR